MKSQLHRIRRFTTLKICELKLLLGKKYKLNLNLNQVDQIHPNHRINEAQLVRQLN